MKNQLTPTGTWQVNEIGNLVYLDQDKEIFNVESGCLANPNLFYDFLCQTNFNIFDFAPNYLLAAQKADLDQITIKLKDTD